ncbi:MAG: 30S ribosomal protein S18 [Candidatus Obscuribacterales bacterium]|nr:30S ribosomal protein S18 [Candidatus Obscuribacterales bacterium]
MSALRKERSELSRGKRPCKLCQEKIVQIDYKDAFKLKRFLSEQGKIVSRRISGNCAEHQKEVTLAIKRAREISLLSLD